MNESKRYAEIVKSEKEASEQADCYNESRDTICVRIYDDDFE